MFLSVSDRKQAVGILKRSLKLDFNLQCKDVRK